MKGALIFSSVLMLANQGNPLTGPGDPAPHLLFYAAIALAAFLTMWDRGGSIMERMRRRRAEEDGVSKGGLVTYDAHKADVTTLRESIHNLTILVGGAVSINQHNADLTTLHAKLESMDRERQERAHRLENSLSHVANEMAEMTGKTNVIYDLLIGSGMFNPKPSAPK